MKPKGNHIIVRAALDQKETIRYGTLTLFVPFKSQYNSNEREGNPVLAEVMAANDHYPEVKKGDIVLLHHGTILNQALRLWMEDKDAILAVPMDRWVIGKLGKGGEVIPLHGNLVAQRRYTRAASSIIITPDAYRTTDTYRMNVLSVAKDIKHIIPGDTVVCFEHSDYEVVYNVDGQEYRSILIYEGDVLAAEG